MNLELVGERLDLHELRRLGVAVEQPRGRAQQVEILVHLLDDPGICAIDAVASGSGSIRVKSSASRSSWITASIFWSNGTGGTSSTSRASSSI
jgi:hypothetical protein